MNEHEQAATLRAQIESIARPCLILGLAALVISGGAYLYYLPRAYGWNQLTLEILKHATIGAALWNLPHAVVLLWLRRGGNAPLVLFFLLGPVVLGGLALVAWSLVSHPAGALVVGPLGGWVLAVEMVHVLRLLKTNG